MNAAALSRPLAALGRATLALMAATGRLSLFVGETLSHLLRPPFYLREFWLACLNIGWLSLPVVGMTALFTGAALALHRRLPVLAPERHAAGVSTPCCTPEASPNYLLTPSCEHAPSTAAVSCTQARTTTRRAASAGPCTR